MSNRIFFQAAIEKQDQFMQCTVAFCIASWLVFCDEHKSAYFNLRTSLFTHFSRQCFGNRFIDFYSSARQIVMKASVFILEGNQQYRSVIDNDCVSANTHVISLHVS